MIMKKTFVRVRSVRDVVIFSTLLIAGALLIALPTSPAVNITGFLMICSGSILAFILKTGYRDADTKEIYFKKEHFFQHAVSAQIAAAIASKPDTVDLSAENLGNSMRLDVYYSKTSNKAYIQLYEYIPYMYEPCTEMYEYDLSKVTKLVA